RPARFRGASTTVRFLAVVVVPAHGRPPWRRVAQDASGPRPIIPLDPVRASEAVTTTVWWVVGDEPPSARAGPQNLSANAAPRSAKSTMRTSATRGRVRLPHRGPVVSRV